MSAYLLLVLRILLIASLYFFLGWCIYTIWRDLNINSQIINQQNIPKITLTPIDSDLSFKEFSISEIIIGRDPSCTFPIQDETVSGLHARLSYHHKHWWIEDLNSTNGTYLNDERIISAAVILNGDQIRCGGFIIHLTYSS